MPRLSTSTKSTRGKAISCDACRKPIEVGQDYYFWQFRYSPKRTRHTACGRPKPSELTQSKLSAAYAAVESAEEQLPGCDEAADIAQVLRDCASEIDNVRQEYQDGLDNMPDGLRDAAENGQTGETMQSLEDFQQNLESAADDIEGEDAPEEADDGEELEETRENWISGLRDRAVDALSDRNF